MVKGIQINWILEVSLHFYHLSRNLAQINRISRDTTGKCL